MDEIRELTLRLLQAVAEADWQTYQGLCSPDMTCFEPETEGRLVSGLEFHKQFFDVGGHMGRHTSDVEDLRVRMLGADSALVTYRRIVSGESGSTVFIETRVWQRTAGRWKHVHFHRSVVG